MDIATCHGNRFSTKMAPVCCWSHFHAPRFLALSSWFSSRLHPCFFLKAVIPGHMEPIPLSSVALSRPRASGGGCVSMWRGSVTVSPGCPPIVDTLSWAAYCRPDVGTHLQLAWKCTDKLGLLDQQTLQIFHFDLHTFLDRSLSASSASHSDHCPHRSPTRAPVPS